MARGRTTDPLHLAALARSLGEIAARNQAVKWGVADLNALADRYPDLMERIGDVPVIRAFVVAMRVHRAVLATIRGRPNALYMHHYRQINYKLDRIALECGALLERHGWLGLPIAASQTITRKPMLGHISHRLLAQWAGLGWRGRNNLLVTPEYGAQVRLVSILTDAPLEPAAPVLVSGCGSCRACLDACPARAIREDVEDFDLQACFRQLCEFTHIPFVSHHICGVCQKVCGPKEG